MKNDLEIEMITGKCESVGGMTKGNRRKGKG